MRERGGGRGREEGGERRWGDRGVRREGRGTEGEREG